MSLHFSKDEDAVFVGPEAEGPNQGMQTMFVVGNPPIDVLIDLLAYQLHTHQSVGIYIGAGCNIHNVLEPKTLDALLHSYIINHKVINIISRVTIEATDLTKYSLYKAVLMKYKIIERIWILPLVYPDYKMSTLTAQSIKEASKQEPIKFFAKVYMPGGVLFTAPLHACYFADFENNKGAFQKDQLHWSSSIPTKE